MNTNNNLTFGRFGSLTTKKLKKEQWEEKLTQIQINSYGTTDENGIRLDCYWNVAQNLRNNISFSTADETQALMELNAAKDEATGEYNSIVQDGQTINLTFNLIIDEITDAVNAACADIDNLTGKYNECCEALRNNEDAGLTEELEKDIKSAKAQLDNAKEQYKELLQALQNINEEKANTLEANENQKQQIQKQIEILNDKIDLKEVQADTPADTGEINSIGDLKKDDYEKLAEVSIKSFDFEKLKMQINGEATLFIGKKNENCTINQILDNYSSDQIVQIINEYNKKYHESMINFIDSQNNVANNEYLAEKMLDAAKNGENKEAAIKLICEEIYNATAGRNGTADEFVKAIINENTDSKILTEVIEKYGEYNKNKSGNPRDLIKDIKDEILFNDKNELLAILNTKYIDAYLQENYELSENTDTETLKKGLKTLAAKNQNEKTHIKENPNYNKNNSNLDDNTKKVVNNLISNYNNCNEQNMKNKYGELIKTFVQNLSLSVRNEFFENEPRLKEIYDELS